VWSVPDPPPPPPGLPWDLPIAEAPLAFLDLEMTGLDAEKDRVVEICLERWIGERLDRSVASLVRPPERAGGNAHVHGLDEKALASAPSFDALADDVLSALEGAVIVAHAAMWDVAFLRAEMKRAGKTFEVSHWIDTLTLSRRAFGLDSHSLAALCKHFGIDPGKHHRATDDVRALRSVFAKCVATLAPTSVRDLWHVRIAERHARPAIVEACTRAAESGKPVSITYRPSHRAAHTMRFVIKEVTGVHVSGYELPSHSRRLLRADRILQVDDDDGES
jgi:DNA polymerase-3 subunit epsilon